MRLPPAVHLAHRWAGGAVILTLTASLLGACGPGRKPDLVIGVPQPVTTTTHPEEIGGVPSEAMAGDGPGVAAGTEVAGDPRTGGSAGSSLRTSGRTGGGRPEPRATSGLTRPDGSPWRPPVAFSTSEPFPRSVAFILVIGSDARPREDVRRTRADSIHLLAINPSSRQGTLVGLPRDSYVDIPGRGKGKINAALALGGPDLLAETVRRVTRLPVDFYVLTGFEGLKLIVDELGGVDVNVTRRMNDRASGALFEPGWHRFDGREVLAFSRNRNDVAAGDFSRSEHQGAVMLSALAKMRAEVADDRGVARWSAVLLRHAELNLPMSRLPQLGALARRLDPSRLTNVVAAGRVGTAGRASVVYLTDGAYRLFDDLRPDGVIGAPDGGPGPDPAPENSPGRGSPGSTTTTTTTSTTAPAPAQVPTSSTTTTAPGAIPLLPTSTTTTRP